MISTHLALFSFFDGMGQGVTPPPAVTSGGGGTVIKRYEMWRDMYVRHRRRRILKQSRLDKG